MPAHSWWAKRITGTLGRVYPLAPEQREVVEYGLVVMLSNLISLILITGAAAVRGLLFPTFLVLSAAGGLRLSAGGAHCSAPWRCGLMGVLVFPLLGYLVGIVSTWQPILIGGYILVALAGAVGAVLWRAPALTANKPLPALRRQRLRLRSLITVFGMSVLALILLGRGFDQVAVGLSTGLLWEGFTLLPLGWRVIGSFDRFLSGGYTTRRKGG